MNIVPIGAVFAGIRRYFLYMPLFFLPMLYDFSDSEIKNQLKFILVMALIQCPFAIYQRFFLFRHIRTGDFITGTLATSPILSIFQILSIAVLSAFYFKKKLKLSSFLILSLIIFIPATLNETKATFILFPLAILSTIFFGGGQIFNLKKFLMISIGTLTIIFLFIPVYNYMANFNREHKANKNSIIDFFLKGEVYNYLYKGTPDNYTETLDNKGGEKVGRIDALLFPFKKLSKEPLQLIVGLGIGNVNSSFIKGFQGEYTEFEEYGAGKIAAASLIWETGLIGIGLYCVFFWIIFTDSLALKSMEGTFGALALGWIAVIFVLGLSFFYANIFHQKVCGFLFWYFSGVIASKRVCMQAETKSLQPYNTYRTVIS